MGFIRRIVAKIKKSTEIHHKTVLDEKENQLNVDKHNATSNLLINKSGGQPW
ncbi:hypothetical protein [Candidatus Lokiarchaeum ossiferum]|uniref:hypothetical protein n=1 Tax=Candidatus Lokiarchaeum ossiferum TaxID=2951803 RepID=UPI00352FE9B0